MKAILYFIGLVLGVLAYANLITLDLTEYDVMAYLIFGWLGYVVFTRSFWSTRSALFSLFSCTTTPSRSCDDCPTDELNKIVHIAFVTRGTAIDTETMVEDILAAELDGNAYIIRNISGAYDGGRASKGKGAGKQVSRTLGKKHTLNFTDFAYVGNEQFWNDFEKQAQNYDIYFFTDTRGWVVINAYVSAEAQGIITDNNETNIESNIILEWAKRENPVSYLAEVDDLSNCQTLFTGVSFTNVSGSMATIIQGTIDEISLTQNVTAINATLNAGHPVFSVSVVEGTLPTGLSLSTSGNYVRITGTATQAPGTYNVTLKVSNETGVSALKEVKFIIS